MSSCFTQYIRLHERHRQWELLLRSRSYGCDDDEFERRLQGIVCSVFNALSAFAQSASDHLGSLQWIHRRRFPNPDVWSYIGIRDRMLMPRPELVNQLVEVTMAPGGGGDEPSLKVTGFGTMSADSKLYFVSVPMPNMYASSESYTMTDLTSNIFVPLRKPLPSQAQPSVPESSVPPARRHTTPADIYTSTDSRAAVQPVEHADIQAPITCMRPVEHTDIQASNTCITENDERQTNEMQLVITAGKSQTVLQNNQDVQRAPDMQENEVQTSPELAYIQEPLPEPPPPPPITTEIEVQTSPDLAYVQETLPEPPPLSPPIMTECEVQTSPEIVPTPTPPPIIETCSRGNSPIEEFLRLPVTPTEEKGFGSEHSILSPPVTPYPVTPVEELGVGSDTAIYIPTPVAEAMTQSTVEIRTTECSPVEELNPDKVDAKVGNEYVEKEKNLVETKEEGTNTPCRSESFQEAETNTPCRSESFQEAETNTPSRRESLQEAGTNARSRRESLIDTGSNTSRRESFQEAGPNTSSRRKSFLDTGSNTSRRESFQDAGTNTSFRSESLQEEMPSTSTDHKSRKTSWQETKKGGEQSVSFSPGSSGQTYKESNVDMPHSVVREDVIRLTEMTTNSTSTVIETYDIKYVCEEIFDKSPSRVLKKHESDGSPHVSIERRVSRAFSVSPDSSGKVKGLLKSRKKSRSKENVPRRKFSEGSNRSNSRSRSPSRTRHQSISPAITFSKESHAQRSLYSDIEYEDDNILIKSTSPQLSFSQTSNQSNSRSNSEREPSISPRIIFSNESQTLSTQEVHQPAAVVSPLKQSNSSVNLSLIATPSFSAEKISVSPVLSPPIKPVSLMNQLHKPVYFIGDKSPPRILSSQNKSTISKQSITSPVLLPQESQNQLHKLKRSPKNKTSSPRSSPKNRARNSAPSSVRASLVNNSDKRISSSPIHKKRSPKDRVRQNKTLDQVEAISVSSSVSENHHLNEEMAVFKFSADKKDMPLNKHYSKSVSSSPEKRSLIHKSPHDVIPQCPPEIVPQYKRAPSPQKMEILKDNAISEVIPLQVEHLSHIVTEPPILPQSEYSTECVQTQQFSQAEKQSSGEKTILLELPQSEMRSPGDKEYSPVSLQLDSTSREKTSSPMLLQTKENLPNTNTFSQEFLESKKSSSNTKPLSSMLLQSGTFPTEVIDSIVHLTLDVHPALDKSPSLQYSSPDTTPLKQSSPDKKTPSLQQSSPEKKTPSLQYSSPSRKTPSPDRKTPSLQQSSPEKKTPSLQYSSPSRKTPSPDRKTPSPQYSSPHKKTPSPLILQSRMYTECNETQSKVMPQSSNMHKLSSPLLCLPSETHSTHNRKPSPEHRQSKHYSPAEKVPSSMSLTTDQYAKHVKTPSPMLSQLEYTPNSRTPSTVLLHSETKLAQSNVSSHLTYRKSPPSVILQNENQLQIEKTMSEGFPEKYSPNDMTLTFTNSLTTQCTSQCSISSGQNSSSNIFLQTKTSTSAFTATLEFAEAKLKEIHMTRYSEGVKLENYDQNKVNVTLHENIDLKQQIQSLSGNSAIHQIGDARFPLFYQQNMHVDYVQVSPCLQESGGATEKSDLILSTTDGIAEKYQINSGKCITPVPTLTQLPPVHYSPVEYTCEPLRKKHSVHSQDTLHSQEINLSPNKCMEINQNITDLYPKERPSLSPHYQALESPYKVYASEKTLRDDYHISPQTSSIKSSILSTRSPDGSPKVSSSLFRSPSPARMTSFCLPKGNNCSVSPSTNGNEVSPKIYHTTTMSPARIKPPFVPVSSNVDDKAMKAHRLHFSSSPSRSLKMQLTHYSASIQRSATVKMRSAPFSKSHPKILSPARFIPLISNELKGIRSKQKEKVPVHISPISTQIFLESSIKQKLLSPPSLQGSKYATPMEAVSPSDINVRKSFQEIGRKKYEDVVISSTPKSSIQSSPYILQDSENMLFNTSTDVPTAKSILSQELQNIDVTSPKGVEFSLNEGFSRPFFNEVEKSSILHSSIPQRYQDGDKTFQKKNMLFKKPQYNASSEMFIRPQRSFKETAHMLHNKPIKLPSAIKSSSLSQLIAAQRSPEIFKQKRSPHLLADKSEKVDESLKAKPPIPSSQRVLLQSPLSIAQPKSVLQTSAKTSSLSQLIAAQRRKAQRIHLTSSSSSSTDLGPNKSPANQYEPKIFQGQNRVNRETTEHKRPSPLIVSDVTQDKTPTQIISLKKAPFPLPADYMTTSVVQKRVVHDNLPPSATVTITRKKVSYTAEPITDSSSQETSLPSPPKILSWPYTTPVTLPHPIPLQPGRTATTRKTALSAMTSPEHAPMYFNLHGKDIPLKVAHFSPQLSSHFKTETYQPDIKTSSELPFSKFGPHFHQLKEKQKQIQTPSASSISPAAYQTIPTNTYQSIESSKAPVQRPSSVPRSHIIITSPNDALSCMRDLDHKSEQNVTSSVNKYSPDRSTISSKNAHNILTSPGKDMDFRQRMKQQLLSEKPEENKATGTLQRPGEDISSFFSNFLEESSRRGISSSLSPRSNSFTQFQPPNKRPAVDPEERARLLQERRERNRTSQSSYPDTRDRASENDARLTYDNGVNLVSYSPCVPPETEIIFPDARESQIPFSQQLQSHRHKRGIVGDTREYLQRANQAMQRETIKDILENSIKGKPRHLRHVSFIDKNVNKFSDIGHTYTNQNAAEFSESINKFDAHEKLTEECEKQSMRVEGAHDVPFLTVYGTHAKREGYAGFSVSERSQYLTNCDENDKRQRHPEANDTRNVLHGDNLQGKVAEVEHTTSSDFNPRSLQQNREYLIANAARQFEILKSQPKTFNKNEGCKGTIHPKCINLSLEHKEIKQAMLQKKDDAMVTTDKHIAVNKITSMKNTNLSSIKQEQNQKRTLTYTDRTRRVSVSAERKQLREYIVTGNPFKANPRDSHMQVHDQSEHLHNASFNIQQIPKKIKVDGNSMTKVPQEPDHAKSDYEFSTELGREPQVHDESPNESSDSENPLSLSEELRNAGWSPEPHFREYSPDPFEQGNDRENISEKKRDKYSQDERTGTLLPSFARGKYFCDLNESSNALTPSSNNDIICTENDICLWKYENARQSQLINSNEDFHPDEEIYLYKSNNYDGRNDKFEFSTSEDEREEKSAYWCEMGERILNNTLDVENDFENDSYQDSNSAPESFDISFPAADNIHTLSLQTLPVLQHRHSQHDNKNNSGDDDVDNYNYKLAAAQTPLDETPYENAAFDLLKHCAELNGASGGSNLYKDGRYHNDHTQNQPITNSRSSMTRKRRSIGRSYLSRLLSRKYSEQNMAQLHPDNCFQMTSSRTKSKDKDGRHIMRTHKHSICEGGGDVEERCRDTDLGKYVVVNGDYYNRGERPHITNDMNQDESYWKECNCITELTSALSLKEHPRYDRRLIEDRHENSVKEKNLHCLQYKEADCVDPEIVAPIYEAGEILDSAPFVPSKDSVLVTSKYSDYDFSDNAMRDRSNFSERCTRDSDIITEEFFCDECLDPGLGGRIHIQRDPRLEEPPLGTMQKIEAKHEAQHPDDDTSYATAESEYYQSHIVQTPSHSASPLASNSPSRKNNSQTCDGVAVTQSMVEAYGYNPLTESPFTARGYLGLQQETGSLDHISVPFVKRKALAFLRTDKEEFVEVGRGTYGIVYLAEATTRRGTAKVVVKDFFSDSTTWELIVHEARLLCYLQDTGVIPHFYGLLKRRSMNDDYSLIQQYFGQGKTLHTVLVNKESLPPLVWQDVSWQLARGLLLIHEHHVLLNDLKGDNVLIDMRRERKVIKYIDLGMATYRKGLNFHLPEDQMSKFNFLAPEVRAGAFTSPMSDVYSLGYLLDQINRLAKLHVLRDVSSRCMYELPVSRPHLPDIVDSLQLDTDLFTAAYMCEATNTSNNFYDCADYGDDT